MRLDSRGWCKAAIFTIVLLANGRARADQSCPAGPIVFDEGSYHGFYVQSLNGTSLETVTLRYFIGGQIGFPYAITLTARQGAYDGPILGIQTQSVSAPHPSGPVQLTFDFGGIAVPPGTPVTFTQSISGGPPDGTISVDAGPCALGDMACGACPGFIETEDTAPPLSTFRRKSFAATITAGGTGAAAAAIPVYGKAAGLTAIVLLAAAALWLQRR